MSEEEFRSVRQDLKQLERRVNVLTQARSSGGSGKGDVDERVRERIEELERRFQKVQSQVAAGGGETGERLSGSEVAEAPAVRKLDERVSELESDFMDFEEYVYDWNEAVETYLYALRRVVDEKLDVSFDSYLELVGSEESDGLED